MASGKLINVNFMGTSEWTRGKGNTMEMAKMAETVEMLSESIYHIV